MPETRKLLNLTERKHITDFGKKDRGLLIPYMKFSNHNKFYKNSSYNSLQAVYARDFAGVF